MDETEILSDQVIDDCVQSLHQSFQICHVGNSAFLATSYHIERLALAIHNPAVVSALRIHNRLEVLVGMLLAIEGWRTFVLPNGLATNLEASKQFLRVTFILHTELTLITLINAMLIGTCNQLKEESSIAVIDYCARSMQVLGEPIHRNRVVLHQRLLAPSVSSIQDIILNAEFRSCILAATTLVRNFCESFDDLSLSSQTRLLETRDLLMLLIPLIEEPPWTRKRVDKEAGKTWEKFIDNEWREVKKENLLKMTQFEGQCWISLFYLTCNRNCRTRYRLTPLRKATLLKLQTFLREDAIVKQLENLEDVRMYLSKLKDTEVPENAILQPMMEQIDIIRENVQGTKDWNEIANNQFEEIFSKINDALDCDVHRLGLLHATFSVHPDGADINNLSKENCSGSQIEKSNSCKSVAVLELQFEHEASALKFDLLFRDNNTTTMETDYGTFQRRSLDIKGPSKEGLPMNQSKVVALVTFMNGVSTVLRHENIGLTTNKMTSREWRQLGSLEIGLVLQLGFKYLSTCENGILYYHLDKAFLSQQ